MGVQWQGFLTMGMNLPVYSKLNSKLCYYLRSIGQSISVSNTHLGLRTSFFFCLTVAGLLMWGARSEEKTNLSFTMYNIFIFYVLLHECIYCCVYTDIGIVTY
jgi:hypothetical protein